MKRIRIAVMMAAAGLASSGQTQPATGQLPPGFEAVDATVKQLMTRFQLPGATLGITYDGRLVLARGYGYLERESFTQAQPNTRFRMGNVSQLLTAAAVTKLVEQGRFGLDDKAFPLLGTLIPPTGVTPNGQLQDITIRHLLEHRGGWDRLRSGFDPMAALTEVAAALGAPAPATCEMAIRFMLGRPLEFVPGSRAAFSDFGYCVLGQVVSRAAGKPYAEAVKDLVLTPAGIERIAAGRSLREDRLEDEAFYYDFLGAPFPPSAFPTGPRTVPAPYGSFVLESAAATSGWVGSTVDLLRLLAALNGTRGPQLFRNPTLGSPLYLPPGNAFGSWLGNGTLPGSMAWLRMDQRIGWAFLTNTRPASAEILSVLDPALTAAIRGVLTWPTQDLFGEFPSLPLFQKTEEFVDFNMIRGGAVPAPREVKLLAGGAEFDVRVGAVAAPWLRVTPDRGTTSTALQFSVRPEGLAPGEYETTVLVTGANAVNQVAVRVRLFISDAVQITAVTNSASFATGALAPGQFFTLFGANLASTTATAAELGTELVGVKVSFSRAGVVREARVYYVSPTQVIGITPEDIALGNQTLTLTRGDGRASSVPAQLATTAPGIFTANASGRGVPAAIVQRFTAGRTEPITVPLFDCSSGTCQPVPLDLGGPEDDTVMLIFGTGWRGRRTDLIVGAADQGLEVLYAGPQGTFPGLDQINVRLPRSLAGKGTVPMVVVADGTVSNIVEIVLR